MSKKNLGSVAPKERINIKYTPNTGGAQAEVELPLNMLIVGDMKGKTEETPIEDRKAISVNQNNFNSVMESAGINLNINVRNTLEESSDSELNVNLDVKSLQDFSPDSIAPKCPN